MGQPICGRCNAPVNFKRDESGQMVAFDGEQPHVCHSPLPDGPERPVAEENSIDARKGLSEQPRRRARREYAGYPRNALEAMQAQAAVEPPQDEPQ